MCRSAMSPEFGNEEKGTEARGFALPNMHFSRVWGLRYSIKVPPLTRGRCTRQGGLISFIQLRSKWEHEALAHRAHLLIEM